jgi:hypothetical protein
MKKIIKKDKSGKQMRNTAIEVRKKTKEISILSHSITTDVEKSFKKLVQDFISNIEQH